MKIGKHSGARIFLIIECIIFFGMYGFGSNGITAIVAIKNDMQHLNCEVAQLKTEIAQLQSTLVLQQKHPFFQEKIAREQLQMARDTEEIYLLS
jgi:cell division protein FtsB